MKTLKLILILFLIPSFSFPQDVNSLIIGDLKCEYLVSPLGIDVSAPRLSWTIKAANEQVFNQRQEAYQILVASSRDKLTEAEADLWNSGKIKSDATTQLVYKGKTLVSAQQCYWKVKIWINSTGSTPWSEIAYWRMGLLEKANWIGKWIGDKPDLVQKAYKDELAKNDPASYDPHKNGTLKNLRPVPPASPMIRKKFTSKSEVKDATLYVSALGYYEINLNGSKVGDQVLAPEWTDFNKRVQYQVFDVTKAIHPGENVLASTLGDGWYLGMLGPTKWHRDYPRRGVYGNDRRLIAQLVINYTDGTHEVIATDKSWKINTKGFITDADNFLGENIDARNIPQGWKGINFDDSSWENVTEDEKVDKNLEGQKNEPVRVYKMLPPVTISQLGDKYIVDFGQSITGWTKLALKGIEGAAIKIRHGEMLDDDGSLYTKNLAAAIQEDNYILSGGDDLFEPSFTYHGFRYIEISGLTHAPEKETITACVISSDPAVTGSFECSNPKLNQLVKNILWTQRDNMTSIPTDCPQRDERMGWMGDAQVFCQNSIFNMDMAAFYTKWIKDIRDAQAARGAFPDITPHSNKPDIRFSNAPAWGDAGVIVPWRMYQNYGDKEVLRQHYSAIKRYLENIRAQNPNFLWLKDIGNNYGDWLNANTIIAEGYSKTRGEIPKDVFATAYYANSARLFSQIAHVLGNEKDAKEYNVLFENIRAKFNEAFVDQDGKIKGNTQSAYALALNFELLPANKQIPAFNNLLKCIEEYDYRISTGFMTTTMMMKELVKYGRTDIAYKFLESERLPSWIYSINQGATTIWERWDGYVKGRGFQDAGMNSFCHYSIGAVGEWMYRNVLGINPDDRFPGFKHFTIHPRPGGTLTWAKGSYNSIHGLISSDWKKENGKFTLSIEIPVNTSASVTLPTGLVELIQLNSKPVQATWVNNDYQVGNETTLELGSGKYLIEVGGQQ
jgi:alpha-L-rhamnosidase